MYGWKWLIPENDWHTFRKPDSTIEIDSVQRDVYNWVFEQGLQVMKYNEVTEEWFTSDGEIYSTDCILREVARNAHT